MENFHKEQQMSVFKPHFSAFSSLKIPTSGGIFFTLFSLFLYFPDIVLAAGFGSGCTTRDCHGGIMDIVPEPLPMIQLIKQNGQRHGDPGGCVICHGGNPKVSDKKRAHRSVPKSLARAPGPKAFYPDPGSIWIVDNTCGVCHAGYGYRAKRSLMNTEAGKIQGNLHTWGIDPVKNYQVPWGNYAITDRDGPIPMGTSPAYEVYMAELIQAYPAQFPTRLDLLPAPSVKEIEQNPKLAGITYQRQECQRCHIGVRGRQVRGDYRGMGCSACHMLYSNEGLYQGKDKSIPKDEPGHILRHRIAGNKKTGGIPVESCNTCHNRGKRIGVSYTGLMETASQGPFDSGGNPAPKLHGKNYLRVSEDLHHRRRSRQGNPDGGLLCQDCHTSMDVHGDGNIHGTTLGQVEIECTDCHGTPTRYPWELPLGHGDEFGKTINQEIPRGLGSTRLLSDQQFGYDHEKQDGFILSARGNPLGNVVKKETAVVVHSARGNDFKVPVLKTLQIQSQWKAPSAGIAMAKVSKHMERMECYACHAAWVPQCYGCHVKVDFSKKNGQQTDWVASGNAQTPDGQTAESRRSDKKRVELKRTGGITTPGIVTEQNGYRRWEDPILGINGEGRISPLMPGCQMVYTVLGSDGRVLVYNEIPLNPGEAASLGQAHLPLSIDMAPAQPHTNQAKARVCEGCHTRPKTMGLGINNGLFKTLVQQDRIVAVEDPKTGQVMADQSRSQISGVAALAFDWSQIVTREGKQLATVGTHWPLSRAFNKTELDRILRTGLCMGCHGQMGRHGQMGSPGIWQKFSATGPLDTSSHNQLMEKMVKQYQP